MRTATEPAHDACVTGSVTGDAPHGEAHGIDLAHRCPGAGQAGRDADSPWSPAGR